jgi:hypothetical protein
MEKRRILPAVQELGLAVVRRDMDNPTEGQARSCLEASAALSTAWCAIANPMRFPAS